MTRNTTKHLYHLSHLWISLDVELITYLIKYAFRFHSKTSTFQQVSALLLPKGHQKFPISLIFLKGIFETRQDPPGYKFFLHLPFLACRKEFCFLDIPRVSKGRFKEFQKRKERECRNKRNNH